MIKVKTRNNKRDFKFDIIVISKGIHISTVSCNKDSWIIQVLTNILGYCHESCWLNLYTYQPWQRSRVKNTYIKIFLIGISYLMFLLLILSLLLRSYYCHILTISSRYCQTSTDRHEEDQVNKTKKTIGKYERNQSTAFNGRLLCH